MHTWLKEKRASWGMLEKGQHHMRGRESRDADHRRESYLPGSECRETLRFSAQSHAAKVCAELWLVYVVSRCSFASESCEESYDLCAVRNFL